MIGRQSLSPKAGHPVLDLGHGDARSRDALIVSDSNREAVAWIDRWPDWPVNGLALAGGAGSGKTHLSDLWQGRSDAIALNAETIAGFDLAKYINSPVNVMIDDAERACPDALSEKAFFHLFNAVREAGKSLLLASPECPARWPIRLADLKSRLSSLPCVIIAPPDDDMLVALLGKLFSDRQVRVSDDVLAYIANRIERSCRSVQLLVSRLDSLALARQSAVTIPLVKSVLDEEINPTLPL